MKYNKAPFKIGQKVFIITKNIEIEEKEVIAVINTHDKIGYTLDENSCGGYSELDVFETKNKAEVVKHNFLEELRFKVGDIILFRYKAYRESKEEVIIAKVKHIYFRTNPYCVENYNHSIHGLNESNIILKVKNEYIENFGNISDLYKEFEEKRKEMSNIVKKISSEHERMETELKQSLRNQLPSWWSKKDKPLFEDRFDYKGENYYG